LGSSTGGVSGHRVVYASKKFLFTFVVVIMF